MGEKVHHRPKESSPQFADEGDFYGPNADLPKGEWIMKATSGASRLLSANLLFRICFAAALCFACLPMPLRAQTVSTWNGGAGAWSDCPPSGTALWDTCGGNPPTFPDGNYNAVINAGQVTATSASIVNLSIGSSGSLLFASGTPGLLTLTGTSLVNNGAISIDSGNGLEILGPTSLTISGSGAISIAGSRFDGSNTPNVTLQQPLSGNGAFALGMNLTNQSTINATGGTLEMQPSSVVNTGTFEASTGATLSFSPGGPVSFNNTGGVIKALNGGVVQLFSSTYTGGTLATVGTGVIQATGDAILNNLTNTGTIQAGTTAVLQNTVTNNGVIQVPGATLAMTGKVTLTGSGSVILSGSSNVKQFTGSDSLTSQQLIHGSGTIFELPLTNQSTLSADSAGNTLFLSGGTTTNTSLMQATGGGILELDTVVNNSGGTIEAFPGSTVIFTNNFNGSINGGTLTTSGTGVIESRNGVLDGTVNIPTNAGKLLVKNSDLFFQGTINNTGTITLSGNSCISLNQPSVLTGSGHLIMASTTCIDGSGLAFTNQSTIQGSGLIGDSNPMPITNTGTIIANQSPNPITIHPNSTGFTNMGKLAVNSGSTLNVIAPFNNLSSTGTLSGGTYSVTGTLGIPGAVVANGGNITLTGVKAELQNTSTLTNALSALAANATTGALALMNGQALTTSANFSNSGKTTVGAASSFTVGGSYTQLAGSTTVDGTLTTAPFGLSLQKGTLVGKGTIASAITSSASVTAGDSTTKPGILTVNGSFAQESTGTLNISLGGTTAGTFGDLAISNGVSLAGKLAIKLINGFVPAIGDNFTIVSGSVVTGKFATVTGTSINSSEHFQVNYNSTDVTLTVVAGP